MIAGEIAAKRKDWERAILHLERAVRYEDALVYQEPPDWHVPARQNLAVVLMAAGRADEAETVLWEDLKRNPDHVWNLSLLSKALRLQNKTADAALIDARLAKSSKGASDMVSFTHRRELRRRRVSLDVVRLSNGVTLHYASQGPRTGPAVIMLHGFTRIHGSRSAGSCRCCRPSCA